MNKPKFSSSLEKAITPLVQAIQEEYQQTNSPEESFKIILSFLKTFSEMSYQLYLEKVSKKSLQGELK